METKAEIRDYMKNQRKNMDKNYIHTISEKICENILALDEYKKSDIVYMYAAVRNEIDLLPLLDIMHSDNKIVVFPKVHTKTDMDFYVVKNIGDLEKGSMGIKEPKAGLINAKALYNERKYIGMMLVPGLAFSENGKRLGMGAGYYDRYIANNRKNIDVLVGVCGKYQMVNRIPVDEYDINMDIVVTE